MMRDLSRWMWVSISPAHTMPPPASCSFPCAASFGTIAAIRPFSTPMSTTSSGRVLRRALRMMRSMRLPAFPLFGDVIGRAAIALDDRHVGIAAQPGTVRHLDLAAGGIEPWAERARLEFHIEPLEGRTRRQHR